MSGMRTAAYCRLRLEQQPSAICIDALTLDSSQHHRYGQLESVANKLFDMLNKHEHLAAPIAALAAAPTLRSDESRLVRLLQLPNQ